MINEDETTEVTTQGNNRPAYVAYWVKEREGQKGIWQRVGAAWLHRDGQGLNLHLDLVPLDGRITLRVPEEKKEA